MSQETKIDFEKIIKSISAYYANQTTWTKSELKAAARESAREAIRLAAPLFAMQAETKCEAWDEIVVDHQSIIDAVESVTLKIVGE